MKLDPKHYPFLAVLLCAVLYLPGLGRFGLWDPWELKAADPAREMAECKAAKEGLPGGQERAYTFGEIAALKHGRAADVTCGSFTDVTQKGRHVGHPPLSTWSTAVGIRLFGLNEFGVRIGGALWALLAVFLTALYGGRLFSPRVGLLGAVILATTPLFAFEGRQAMGEALHVALEGAAIMGFACFMWPEDGRRRPLDLAVGAGGLFVGLLGAGPLIGVLLPLAVIGLALVLGSGYVQPSLGAAASGAEGGAAEGRQAGHIAPGESFVASLPMGTLLGALGGLLALYAIIYGLNSELGSSLIRLVPKRSKVETFDYFVKQVGFGLFPWTALLVPAVGRWLAPRPGEDFGKDRAAWVRLIMILWVGLGYAAATFASRRYGTLLFPALVPVALAVAVLLDEALSATGLVRDSRRRGGSAAQAGEASSPAVEGVLADRMTGLIACVLLVILALDYRHQPTSLMGVHLPQIIKPYPKTAEPFNTVALFTLLTVGAVLVWMIWPRFYEVSPSHWFHKFTLDDRATRMGALVFITGGFLFTTAMVYRQVPKLSQHLSHKSVFDTFKRLHGEGERLAQYRVSSSGTLYYATSAVADLTSEANLVSELRKSSRAFVMLPSDQIGSIHAGLRRQNAPYCVIDASNSRTYLASNRCDGPDQNPLRESVRTEEPRMQKRLSADFEGKVELIGVDLEPVIRRGRKIKITVHYKVKERIPGNYKVFIHFDGPAHRFHGDHIPVEERYPTSQWGAGEYVSDTTEVDVPFMTTPAGTYTVYTGFFSGDKRLKVAQGGVGQENKVFLQRIQIR
jgi:hypothetical protein